MTTTLEDAFKNAMPPQGEDAFDAARPRIMTRSTSGTGLRREFSLIREAVAFHQLPQCTEEMLISVESINPHVREAKYAVRGEIVAKAEALGKQLREDPSSLPFTNLVKCNIGNPQALGQLPLTFPREVLALATCPALLEHPSVGELFAPDAIERARRYLEAVKEGVGAYSASNGVEVVREEVAAFIAERDGYSAKADDVVLSTGASQAICALLQTLISTETDAVLVPVPQYPLYSAAIALNGGSFVGYEMEEDGGWALDVEALQRVTQQAREAGKDMKALVVINPGNPTGQCLSEEEVRQLITFCRQEHLILMADEVYQDNIYSDGKPFVSFKKVWSQMGRPSVPLVSFHSISKGFTGECGLRGGYMEVVGMPDHVRAEVIKLMSISLCSTLTGQLRMGLMVNPPKPGDHSHELYAKEKQAILDSLKRRAVKLTAALNGAPGMSCNPAQGALYAFPRIHLSAAAVSAAGEAGQSPDTFYCMRLLEQTGIVVVPGSGFGQKAGTWHFRMTFLPPEDEFDAIISRMLDFHEKFMAQYP